MSFDIASEAATAGVTKAVSLMATAVHNPVLYSMARSLMQYWADKGGILEVEELNEHSLNAKSLIVVAKTVADTRGTFDNLIGWLDNEHFMAMLRSARGVLFCYNHLRTLACLAQGVS